MRKPGTSYRWSVTQFQRAAVSSGVLPANNPSLSWACSWHTLWRFPPIYRSPTHSVIFLLPALQAKSVLLAKRLPKDHSGGSSKSVTWEGLESLKEIQVSEHAESTVKNVYFLFVVNLPHWPEETSSWAWSVALKECACHYFCFWKLSCNCLFSQNIILAVKFFTDFMNDIITFLVSVATFSSGVSHWTRPLVTDFDWI